MPNRSEIPRPTKHLEKLRALCALSNLGEPLDMGQLVSLVQKSPDPETAVRGILERVPSTSDVLTRKWRGVITDLWSDHHPQVPLLPELSLSGSEVDEAPILKDTRAYLTAALTNPLSLTEEQHEWLVEPQDVMRLATAVPSLNNQQLPAVENEWSYPALRRLRAILQATRLIRPLKGQLVPVRSRIERFQQLPAREQFFILWHADAYHVDWGVFAGLWDKYMRVIQEYLPLLWETAEDAAADQVEDRAHWAVSVLESFRPLWDDEGLLDIRPGHAAALHIVQQHALPTIIDRFLLRDLLERHGLVIIKEEFGSISKFTWTKVGEELMAAENSQQLPCGNDLLKPGPPETPISEADLFGLDG